ncbi:MAG: transcriptional regulator [Fibrobacteres bacterium]|nr:transcriptional regulator [Fibrobacterota bacterium]
MVLKKFTWPAELTLTLIGGKWKGLILNHLLTGESKRFGELKRLSSGISAKILAKHLKELEFDGLITRMVVGADKPRIVYAPTSRSRTLAPVLSVIQQWGEDHLGAYGPDPIPSGHAPVEEPKADFVPAQPAQDGLRFAQPKPDLAGQVAPKSAFEPAKTAPAALATAGAF